MPRFRAADTPAFGLTHEPNAGISESCDGVGGPVCRSVIDDNQHPVAMRLRQHRRDRVADPGRGIIGRNDNADAHITSVRIGSRRKP